MKKHSMELSLSKTNIPSNETPTPTRFIRNCEAIGLFQDLNPFEETFKRAVENVKKGSAKPQPPTCLSKSAGDELHTPQVFLDYAELQEVETDTELAVEKGPRGNIPIDNTEIIEAVVRSEADTSISTDGTQRSAFTSVVNNINPTNESVHVLFEMPNGTILQLSVKPMKNEIVQRREAIKIAPKKTPSDPIVSPAQGSTLLPKKHPPTNPRVKEKLKAFLNGSLKSKLGKSISTLNANSVHVAKQPLGTVSVFDFDNCGSKELGDACNETEDDKKRKILERNRRAASRCREKRKRHMETLINNNKMLTQEVSRLRAEVLRLQTIVMTQANYTLTEITPCSSVSSTVEGEQLIIENPVKVMETPTLEVEDLIQLRQHTQKRKEKLTLDIAKATESNMMDLDSPSIVRCDEVLSSVAHPTTPDDRDPFVELVHQRDMGDTMDKNVNTPTTVIQLNPNLLKSSNTL